ncbi:manganese efflux pump MntP [Massilia sp. LjRoot122]|uniref:manganese efflux pump MntP n=1 Tax=Massilia sp. LjRoot122 TaxID=3342257 RepID=UPI003ECCED03
MTFTALIFLALAMSTDAFAAAIAKGAALRNPGLPQALRIGLLFGCIETITPIIGWGLGSLAADAIRQWDHWIAFVLLLGLGGRMIWLSFGADEDEESGGSQNLLVLVLTAVATSIDAMAVGVGLAFVDVSIMHAAVAIGIATTTMVTIGVLLGRRLGAAVGRNAERIGGVVLVLVGTTILIEHLQH